MPIEIRSEPRRLSQTEFASIAYDVMACTFQVQREIGRFFDEKIYKRMVSRRMSAVELELPIAVRFLDFSKIYFLDMLVCGGAPFEWKTVENLIPEHRGQLLNYLLLCDLAHGKLVNVWPDLVQHEFVNTTLRPQDRRRFQFDDAAFVPVTDSDKRWKEFLSGALLDWGAGLDTNLYESAITHCCGGENLVLRSIDVFHRGQKIGEQRVRFASPNVAFKVTTLHEQTAQFERHAHRFVANTSLHALHWVNVTRKQVSFKTITKEPLEK